MSGEVVRIKPFHYIHVLNNNTNVTTLEIGPLTYTKMDHEKIIFGPEPMVSIPPRHYCKISCPVDRDIKGNLVKDKNGQVKVRMGEEEYRLHQDPFPLYPFENLKEKPQPLIVLVQNQALKLEANRDFVDSEGIQRHPGDQYLFIGPKTYIPRIEEAIVSKETAIIIKENEGVKLKAKVDFIDRDKKKRTVGEVWIYRKTGAFLPYVEEEIVGIINPIILTPTTAVHLRAELTFKDGEVVRHAGEEWIVTNKDCECYRPNVHEKVVKIIHIIMLNTYQFCVVLDPIDQKTKKPRLGMKELRKGEQSFFLYPGEHLESGIQNVFVLSQEESLLLLAKEKTKFEGVEYIPGQRWMIKGPRDFIPPVEVKVIEKRVVIPLDQNEGIYVRNINNGSVRAVIGQSYLLKENEELCEKVLPVQVEELVGKELSRERPIQGKVGIANGSVKRDRTRVVTYRVPHNAAVQIYDYTAKTARVIVGPHLVMLQPDEHFTLLNLSGGTPKVANQIPAITLLLGPDFMTDEISVETSDHARLLLKLSYTWFFDFNKEDRDDSDKIFSSRDFVGDLCETLGSQIRGVVASTPFDEFHKRSTDIVKKAIFGDQKSIKFSNNLVVTGVDIHSSEPVDQRTKDSLHKSVQLAIEITTKSQEASARHDSMRMDQEAQGELERQLLGDQANAEKEKK